MMDSFSRILVNLMRVSKKMLRAVALQRTCWQLLLQNELHSRRYLRDLLKFLNYTRLKPAVCRPTWTLLKKNSIKFVFSSIATCKLCACNSSQKRTYQYFWKSCFLEITNARDNEFLTALQNAKNFPLTLLKRS